MLTSNLGSLAASIQRSPTSVRTLGILWSCPAHCTYLAFFKVHSEDGRCYVSIVGQSPIGVTEQNLEKDYYVYSTVTKPT